MTDSGRRRRLGSGVTRAIPTAAPARWPAHGPTFASSLEVLAVAADDELPALEVLRAAGATAGSEDPVEVLRGQDRRSRTAGRPASSRSRRQTDIVRSVRAGHEAAPRVGASASAGHGTGGFGTASSAQRPEAARDSRSSAGRTTRSGSAMRSAGDGRRAVGRLGRRVRPAERPGEERGDGPAVELGTRTASCAGRSSTISDSTAGRPARCRAPARRSRWTGGTTSSASPWMSRTGRSVAP